MVEEKMTSFERFRRSTEINAQNPRTRRTLMGGNVKCGTQIERNSNSPKFPSSKFQVLTLVRSSRPMKIIIFRVKCNNRSVLVIFFECSERHPPVKSGKQFVLVLSWTTRRNCTAFRKHRISWRQTFQSDGHASAKYCQLF